MDQIDPDKAGIFGLSGLPAVEVMVNAINRKYRKGKRMTTDYVKLRQHLQERLAQLGSELPGPMSGFSRLHNKAVQAGANRAELLETIGLAILMGGGPASVYAAHAMDAIQQFLPAPVESGAA